MTEAPEPVERPARRRRWWAAFLLNLFLAPSGYVYAGSVRSALAYLALVFLSAVSLTTWTLLAPPGYYGLAPRSGMMIRVLEFAFALNAVVGLHAAFIAGRPSRSRLRGGALGLTALLVWLVPLILVQAFRALGPIMFYTASSVAMLPTLREGDVLAVQGSRALCGLTPIRPGDVVIHKNPAKPGVRWVKRAVASPGSTVEMRNGVLVVDGRPVRTARSGTMQNPTFPGLPPQSARVLRETLANGATYQTLDLQPDGPLDTVAPVKLGPDQWYVLGDNRDNSQDSRTTGPVARPDICGVVSEILLSTEAGNEGRRP